MEAKSGKPPIFKSVAESEDTSTKESNRDNRTLGPRVVSPYALHPLPGCNKDLSNLGQTFEVRGIVTEIIRVSRAGLGSRALAQH